MKKETIHRLEDAAEMLTDWIGSIPSIIAHSIMFVIMFCLHLFGITLTNILLILTTIVSLEAIYLSIFIQMSVNKTKRHLKNHIKNSKLTKKSK